MKVTAKLSEKTAKEVGVKGEPVTVEANIPETLDELVTTYGKDVVASATIDALVISVQALMRRMMVPKTDKAGKVTKPASTPAEIQSAVAAWRPDVKSVVRQTAFEKASTSLIKLTPEERKALLQQLQAIK